MVATIHEEVIGHFVEIILSYLVSHYSLVGDGVHLVVLFFEQALLVDALVHVGHLDALVCLGLILGFTSHDWKRETLSF